MCSTIGSISGPSMLPASSGPVPSVLREGVSMTMQKIAPGAVSIAVRTGRISTLGFRGSNAQCMGCAQVAVPWAEPKARFTRLFERLAIDVLRECSITGATQILGLSWDEAWHLMERAVARGQTRKAHRVIPQLGIDEKARSQGPSLPDPRLGSGCWNNRVRGGRPEVGSLAAYYKALLAEQRAWIEAVAMDMWEPYVQATQAQVPEAKGKIVFDRFHLMGYLGKAVDTVRKQEHRERLAQGDETLKETKYLWLYSREHLPASRRQGFTALRRLQLKVGRAWAIKETLRELWHFVYPGATCRFWQRWYFWATHSRLRPIREAAATLKWHLANILTYFQHRITNSGE